MYKTVSRFQQGRPVKERINEIHHPEPMDDSACDEESNRIIGGVMENGKIGLRGEDGRVVAKDDPEKYYDENVLAGPAGCDSSFEYWNQPDVELDGKTYDVISGLSKDEREQAGDDDDALPWGGDHIVRVVRKDR
jgi:hypothetical protein